MSRCAAALVHPAAALAACSLLRSSAAAVADCIVLRATAASASRRGAAAPGSLRVARPLAAPGLDTDRIVLVRSGGRMELLRRQPLERHAAAWCRALAVERLRAIRRLERGRGFAAAFHERISAADHRSAASRRNTRAKRRHRLIGCSCTVADRAARDGDAARKLSASRGRCRASANRDERSVVAAFEAAADTALSAVATDSAASCQDREIPGSSMSRYSPVTRLRWIGIDAEVGGVFDARQRAVVPQGVEVVAHLQRERRAPPPVPIATLARQVVVGQVAAREICRAQRHPQARSAP